MEISAKVIGISGLGLLGGSLAAAIKKNIAGVTIVGYDTNEQVRQRALSLGYVDNLENTFDKLVNIADILYLAAPISSVLEQINWLHSFSRPMIVSDVCSVKIPIMKAASTLSPEITFIGGHPMAGSQKSGIEHANPDLFVDTVYLLSPPVTGNIPASFLTLIEAIGARHYIINADIHDMAVSKISHIPQILSVALLNEALGDKTHASVFRELAAGGFRDMTRIGESEFTIWRDILAKNKENIIRDLSKLIVRLQTYKDELQKGATLNIEKEFIHARDLREQLDKK
jgi:prephenate dehydrogenase